MRLIQLARELNLRPGALEERVKAYGATVEVHLNMRLDEATILKLVEEFAPDRVEEFRIRKEPEHFESVVIQEESSQITKSLSEAEDLEVDQSAEPNSDSVTLPDVIRAPKVELPGLKVIGKIELPEPPKKPEPAEAPVEQEQTDKRRNFTRSGGGSFGRVDRRPRRDDNPIARERERQQRQAERQRQEEIRRKKEIRTRAYEQEQARRQAASSSKKKKQEKAQSDRQERPAGPMPKTWIGRLWRWLAHGE